MLNKTSHYEGENIFWYWYKVYVRKSRQTSKLFNFLEFVFIDLMTKYFTSPKRIFTLMIATISFFCFLFCLTGTIKEVPDFSQISKSLELTYLWKGLKFAPLSLNNWETFFSHLGKTLYFSAITFSTIGYGDYQPIGFGTMLLAAIEGIVGVLLMSTFLVTLTRKVLR
jgi:hypothetical protein